MKKISLFLIGLAASLTLNAQPQRVAFDKLPSNSQEFVKQYLSGEQIDHVTLNRDSSWEKYTVYFTDGNEITFDGGSGDCTQIIMKKGAIPAALIPANLHNYLNSHYPNEQVKMLEQIKEGYKVKLSNGKELCFDHNGVCKEGDCKEKRNNNSHKTPRH